MANRINTSSRIRTYLALGCSVLVSVAALPVAQAQTHPLVPAVTIAERTLAHLESAINDYTCTLVKRERINGRLQGHEYIYAKVRQKPFSVYLRYLGPSRVKGREVLYIEGQNGGRVLGRNGGAGNLKNFTKWIDPRSDRALRDNQWPITEFGLVELTRQLVNSGREALEYDATRRECEVRFVDGAKLNGRLARCIQIKFPKRREQLDFHIGRVFIDQENGLPVRFAHYSWPERNGDTPRLIAEYNYVNVKLNVGLTDRDFDHQNPEYSFYLPEESRPQATTVLASHR